MSFVTIWHFKLCHHLGFWVLSQLNFFKVLSSLRFWIMSYIVVFFLVLSEFLFLVWSQINFFEFCHKLRFWVLSQVGVLSFVTIGFFLVFVTNWVFEFCHCFFFSFILCSLRFWVWSQLEFLSFATGWVFKASALWADAFYKSKCPSVRLSVCLSVHFWGTV